jgi:hypothetical protein
MVILDVVCEKRSVHTIVSTNIIRYRHRRVTLIDKQRLGYNKRDMAKVKKGDHSLIPYQEVEAEVSYGNRFGVR